MLEQTATASFTVRCGPCGSTGKVMNDAPCEVCKGAGILVLAGAIENYRDCPNCGASGFMGFDVRDVCVWCNGAGAIHMLD